MVGASVRYGVSDRFDVGGGIGPSGLEVATKVQLTSPTSSTVVSVVPALGGTGTYANDIVLLVYQADLAVLIGVEAPRDMQVVIAPRVHETFVGGAIGPSASTAAM